MSRISVLATLGLALVTPRAIADGPPLTREVFVPYEELLKMAARDPSGVLMSLQEYRALLASALKNRPRIADPGEPPPLNAAPIRAAVTGRFDDGVVRFRAEIDIAVAATGWVRCDLGPAPSHLGRIIVDGVAGWALLEADGGSGKQTTTSRPRLSLILRGVGRHTAVIEFSAAAREVEDHWVLDGVVPQSAATGLVVEVPGDATGDSDPPVLRRDEAGDDRTSFHLGLGRRGDFRLSWKLRRDGGKHPAIFSVRHLVRYRLEPRNPTFTWTAEIEVSRRKTDSIDLVAPPGATVLRARGELVHSFVTVDDVGGTRTRLLLHRPTLDRVVVELEGVLDAPVALPAGPAGEARARFALGRPALHGAIRDHGVIGIESASGSRLVDLDLDRLEPVDADDLAGAPSGVWSWSVDRLFAFHEPESRLEVEVWGVLSAHEVRATHRLRVGERGRRLHSALRIQAIEGRVHRVELVVPRGLRLESITELGTDRGLRPGDLAGITGADGLVATVPIDLVKAIEPGSPAVVHAVLAAVTDRSEGPPRGVAIPVELPSIAGARRRQLALGIELEPALEASLGAVTAWRTVPAAAARALGFDSRRLVAALQMEVSRGESVVPVELTIRTRPSRGVYESVTHSLALDGRLHVHAAVRLSVPGRAIDAIAVSLPISPDAEALVRAPDIREWTAADETGRRLLRFQRPWQGERIVRFEFTVPLAAGEPHDVPLVAVFAVEESGEDDGPGGFDALRFAVLASSGGVLVDSSPGEALVPTEVDDLPEFFDLAARGRTAPGRIVAIYRVNERVPKDARPATLRTTTFERSPILERGISVVEMTTTLDSSGVSRTEATFILRYHGDQHVELDLDDVTLLAVEIDGESIEPVASERGLAARLPLPPRSYASIRLVWERRGDALGYQGTWSEDGPRIFTAAGEEIPVSLVRWVLYLPAGLHVRILGETVDSLAGDAVETFASTFWGEVLRLRLPRWVSWERREVSRPEIAAAPTAAIGSPAPAAAAGASARPLESPPGQGGVHRLRPRQLDTGSDVAAMPLRLRHEGVPVEITKLGVAPRIDVEYRDPSFDRFARRAIFLIAVLLGWSLRSLRPRSFLRAYILGGLGVGTFLPAALARDSLLLHAAAEGIAALAIALTVLWLARRLVRAWTSVLARLAARRRRAASQVTAATVLLAVLALPARHATAQEEGVHDQPVLIPYSLESFDLARAPGKRRVYVPYGKFVELWNLAHPDDEEPATEPAPADVIIGNAAYTMTAAGERYRIEGKLDVRVFTREWTTIPLRFDGVQLARILLDGRPSGVSYENDVPFLAVRGEGEHRLVVTVEGRVKRGLGEAAIAAGLMPGVATTLVAGLPAGVELIRTGRPGSAPVVLESLAPGGRPVVRVDLGRDGRLHLGWRSPSITSDRRPVVSAISASGFTLERDGYSVSRRERVRIEGPPVSHLRFAVRGRWDLSDVGGANVSEWILRPGEGGNDPELEIFFTRAANDFDLVIGGFAPCGVDRVPPAGLGLVGATREEGFIALRHGRTRRFPLDVLDGLRRRSRREFQAEFFGGETTGNVFSAYDRIFHFHGDLEGQRVRSVPLAVEGGVDAQLVGLISTDRVAVAVRVYFDGLVGRRPLEYQVPVPAGWEVRTVRSPAMYDWEVEQTEGERRLVVRFGERATDGTTVEWYAEGPRPDGAALATGIRLPAFRVTGGLRQTSHWVLAADAALELGEGRDTDLTRHPLESSPRWLELDPHMSYRVAYRSVQPGGTLVVTASERRPVVRVTNTTLVRVAGTYVDLKTRVRLRIERRGTSLFRVRLPGAARQVSVRLPNQLRRRDEQTPEGLVLTLTLPSPTLGDVPLDISYRLDRPDGDRVPLQGLEVLDADTAQEYVALVRNALHPLVVETFEGLQPVEEAVDPPDADLARVRAAFDIDRSFLVVGRPWRLVLVEDATMPVAGFEAIVEFAELRTVLASDGTSWTNATYTIQNRTRQFLEIKMPATASLWRVLVNGRPVRVSRQQAASTEDGESILVPVERMTDADLSIKVSLNYTIDPLAIPAAWIAFKPQAPQIVLEGLQSFETLWRVQVPPGYDVSSVGGTLQEVIASVHHGERVRNLIGQIGRIQKRLGSGADGMDRADAPAVTARERDRARKSLRELQRALEDAVQELRQPGGEGDRQFAGSERLQSNVAELARQQAESFQFIDVGARRLDELREDVDLQRTPAGLLPPVDRVFEDASRFLQSDWQRERREDGRDGEGDADSGAGDGTSSTLESFRETLGPVTVPPLPRPSTPGKRDAASARKPPPVQVLGRVGLDELDGQATVVVQTGVDVTMPESGRLYTFRGKVSHPELEVGLVARDLSSRLWHGLGLLFTVASLVLWWRRMAK